jgi:hypothetical protein
MWVVDKIEDEEEEEEPTHLTEMIAEKITFLSSKNKEETSEENKDEE